jgi:hypothetical protein
MGPKPHLVKKVHYSNDPDPERKLKETAGLYSNPPNNVIILCIDKKIQIGIRTDAAHVFDNS